MATNDIDEEVLEELIAAYKDGVRIQDMGEADTSNPFDLRIEIKDAEGETKRAKLANFLPYMEDKVAYGIQFDTSVSDPTCTRIGNSDLHKSLPIQSRMKGCLLDDDGNVVEYLNPSDWTGNVRDGSRGQVMVELPEHWRKFTTDGTVRQVRISEYPLPGYHRVPKAYISAYEAALDRTNLKLASVVNTDAQYRGGNNNSDYDGTYRSFLGLPVTVLSRGNFRKYARARNSAATTEWNCYTYAIHKEVFWLYVVEYANLNSQKAYNAELDSNGYRQGGLGSGVTTLSAATWKSFNGYYPIVPCGTTDSLGNSTGTVSYTAVDGDNATVATFNVPRYRGIENPFGHIRKHTDGINIRISPTTDNGGDGLSKVFVCDDPSSFSDSAYTNYRHVGNEARANGSIKEVIFGEEGDVIASVTGASTSTYFCDYHTTNIPTSEALRAALLGGSSNEGGNAGLAYLYSYIAPSNTDTSNGSHLYFYNRERRPRPTAKNI